MKNIEILEWDSDFFNVNTGKIKKNITINKNNIEQIKEEIKEKNIDFLYYFQKSSNLNNFSLLTKNGFELIDIEVVLENKNIDKIKEEQDPIFLVNDSDKDLNQKELLVLFKNLSNQSRFSKDIQIKKSKCEKLYENWFERYIKKDDSKFLYVIGSKESPEGFVTYKKEKEENQINLSFININKNNRGKGIGNKLIRNSLNQISKKGFTTCNVKTHISNLNAINFYSKNGFKIKETEFIFHFHKKLKKRII